MWADNSVFIYDNLAGMYWFIAVEWRNSQNQREYVFWVNIFLIVLQSIIIRT